MPLFPNESKFGVLISEPKNQDALINLGSALHTLGEYTKAISCYDIALKLDKKNTIITLNFI